MNDDDDLKPTGTGTDATWMGDPNSDLACQAENLGVLSDEAERYCRELRRLSHQIGQMERLIRISDALLRISQPPKSGKFGIAWWKLNGQDMLRRPILGRWVRRVNRRWRIEKVERFSEGMVSRKGTAGVAADQAVEVVRVAREMMKVYRDAVKMFRGVGKSIETSRRKREPWFEKMEGRLRRLHGEVMKVLVTADYTTTPNLEHFFQSYEAAQRDDIEVTEWLDANEEGHWYPAEVDEDLAGEFGEDEEDEDDGVT